MATITVPQIRASLVATIEAVTPTRLAEHPFRRFIESEDLTASADGAPGSHLLRKFQLRQRDSGTEGEVIAYDQVMREESFEIMVAYPALENMAGDLGLDSLRDMMREDYRKLRDALFTPYNYLPAVQRQGPPTATFEEEDDTWWLVLDLSILFYEAMSL